MQKLYLLKTTAGIMGGKMKENGRGANSCMIYLIHYKSLS
jgi:hypothetical protein